MGNHLKKKSVEAFKWNLLDQFLNQAILILGNILLIKLLTPRDFGIFAIPFVIISFFRSIQDVGFSNLIVHDEKLTKSQYRVIQGVLMVAAVLISVLIIIGAPYLSIWTNEVESNNIILMLIPVVILSAFYFIGEAKLRQQLEFKKLFVVNLFAVVISYSIAVLSAYKNLEYTSLIYRYVSYVAALLVGIIFFTRRIYLPRFNFSILKKGSRHAFSIATEDFLQYISTTLDSLFVGRYMGTEVLGFYDRSLRMISNPIQQIAGSFSKVLFPLLSRVKADKAVTRSIYQKTTLLIIAFISTLLLFIYFYARPIVVNLFGEQWIQIITLVKIFCLLAFANTLISLSKYLFASIGETSFILKFTTIFRPILILSILLITYIYRSVELTALLYAFSSLAASIVFFISSLKVIKLRVLRYIVKFGRTISISGMAIFIIVFIDNFLYPCSDFFDLIVHGLMYVSIIGLCHFILKTSSFNLAKKVLALILAKGGSQEF